MISEFLFYEEDADKEEKSNYIHLKIQIRELLRDDFNRKILAKILLDLRKDVSGDTQKRLFKLYRDLGLEQDAFRKLGSWRWEVVSKGILELTLMEVEEAYSFVIKFINDKRATIRKQAEIAAVTLKPDGIDYFLDTTKYKISEWQQLKLLDVLRNKVDFQPPRFKAWLTSTNKHVVLFALRLIKFYNQNDANAALIELVKHRNNQVRQQAIACIQEFYMVDAIPTLKAIFWGSSVDIKIAILGAIGELGSTPDVEFLITVSKNEGNFSVKSKAVGAVNKIVPESIMPTEDIEYVTAYESKNPIREDSDTKKPDKIPKNSENDLSPEHQEVPEFQQAMESETIHPKEIEHETHIETEHPIETQQERDGATEAEHPKEIDRQAHTETKHPVETEQEQEDGTETAYPPEIYIDFPETSGTLYQETQENPVTEETDPQVKKYSPMPNQKIDLEALKAIEVNGEEVIPTLPEAAQDEPQADFDISEITFIPLVVANGEEIPPVAQDARNPEQVEESVETQRTEATNSERILMDIVVVYETVSAEPMDEELEALMAEIQELDFLPIVVDNDIVVVGVEVDPDDPTADGDELTADEVLNNIEVVASEVEAIVFEEDSTLEGYTLSDFEVKFQEIDGTEEEPAVEIEFEADNEIDSTEEKPTVETPVDTEFEAELDTEFDLADDKIIEVENPQVSDVISWLMTDNELRKIECNYDEISAPKNNGIIENLIPDPVYYDEHEAYMMGLLDDLEELGDEREIPLLEELRAQETKVFIKDRIDSIIASFIHEARSKSTVDPKSDTAPEDLPVFSVFADLFKNIGKEEKIILLDEIVAVGDEKEIEFLDALLESPDHDIRKKAQLVLKQLIAKLSHEKPTATYSKGVSKIVAEQIKSDESLSQEIYNGLLSEMELDPAIDSEYLNINFELSESLELDIDKKLMELPVVATEVPAHPTGGSFFSSLRNFTKSLF